ncbi:MAG: zf-HC2 domain-containing protein [Deltaproteobacteria bacterium]|nr:zf-HC2 domain-containing protein [Deltaproteobacteria bacterium]
MKWRCALFQRWLPAYLDGESAPFWQRRFEAHLTACADCRLETEELQQVVERIKAHPLPEPEPAFWEAFSRELHLELAHAVPEPAPRRPWLRVPYYLLGAPVLAVLLLWFASHLTLKPTPVQNAAVAAATDQLVYAGMDDGLWQGEEFPSWDVNAVVADLSEHEREVLLKRLRF